MELASREQVDAVVTGFAPDAIVNCAAATDVDRCEREPHLAYGANAMGVRHLAVAADRVGAHLVHVSTDYVFDGTSGHPYHEWDVTNPLSVYGKSKLGGEREVERHCRWFAIARTAGVFGRRGSDFVQLVHDALARPGSGIRFPDDQIGSPTYAPDLAAVLVRLAVERRMGMFHVVNAGTCSRYQLALDVASLSGGDVAGIEPTTDAALGRSAPRPLFSALDTMALRMGGMPPLRHYREALTEYLGEG
jgi:dTDP-4-dehydrorhamnose reductase